MILYLNGAMLTLVGWAYSLFSFIPSLALYTWFMCSSICAYVSAHSRFGHASSRMRSLICLSVANADSFRSWRFAPAGNSRIIINSSAFSAGLSRSTIQLNELFARLDACGHTFSGIFHKSDAVLYMRN